MINLREKETKEIIQLYSMAIKEFYAKEYLILRISKRNSTVAFPRHNCKDYIFATTTVNYNGVINTKGGFMMISLFLRLIFILRRIFVVWGWCLWPTNTLS